ncbi:MAG: hypothetical protein U0Y10_01825 [Spirosomataceae bacterium]
MVNVEDLNEDELMAWIDQQLSETTLEQPSMRFTENLLDKWEAKTAHSKVKKPSKKAPFYFLLFMSLVAVLGVVLLPSANAENNSVNLDTFITPIAAIFNNPLLWQALLILNGVVGLVLFDRAILKPYFQRRRAAI